MLFYRRKGFGGSCEPEAAFSDLYITLISHCLSIQAATPVKALGAFWSCSDVRGTQGELLFSSTL